MGRCPAGATTIWTTSFNRKKTMTEFDREKLEREGWIRQTVTDEPRLSELVEFYKELAYEVLVVPYDPKLAPGDCTECFDNSGKTKIIYTRKKK